jgi:hypothetical protein
MTQTARRISLKTYIPISRPYLTKVVAPAARIRGKQIPPTEKTIRLAGYNLRIFFYGQPIQDKMFPALAHLETARAGKPDLTIHAFDSHGREPIDSPLTDREYYADREAHSKKEIENNFLGAYLFGENTVNLYDIDSAQAYLWTADAARLPGWVSAAPLRTIFHWFLSGKDICLVHGAVVGYKNKAVLLAAKGGSGKSTTSLSCVLSGMDYVSDDYAALAIDGGRVIAHSLYNTLKLLPDSQKWFPELGESAWAVKAAGGEKAIAFLSSAMPERPARSLPLAAVLVPVIRGQTATAIEPVSKAEVLRSLAPTTLFQLPFAREDAMSRLADIIKRIPSHTVALGQPRLVPDSLKKFLAG